MENDTHSFIIRVWHAAENRKSSTSQWQGSIDHVGSDQRLYFQHLDSIAKFIEEQLGAQTRPAGWFGFQQNLLALFSTQLQRLMVWMRSRLKHGRF